MTHPKADGLDALKREAVQWYKERFDRSDIIGMPSDREVLFDFIDHLAQRGMIVMDKPKHSCPNAGRACFCDGTCRGEKSSGELYRAMLAAATKMEEE